MTTNISPFIGLGTFDIEPGLLSRYKESPRAGRSADRIPAGARFSAPVQNGPGTHPAPTQWVPGLSRG